MRFFFSQLIPLLVWLLLSTGSSAAWAKNPEVPQAGQQVLTNEEQAWLKEHPVIRIANEVDWPPFDFVENSRPAGFSIDYLKLLAKHIGIKLEFVNGYSWDELLQMGIEGKLDVFPAIWKTPEREALLSFTAPYIDTPHILIVSEDEETIHTIDDLRGRRLTAVKGYASTELIQKYYPEIQLIEVLSPIEGLRQVSYGKADAYLGTLGSAIYEIRKNLIPGLKIANQTTLGGHVKAQYLHMAVRKDWSIFSKILDHTINSVTWEEKQKLLDKWLVLPSQKPDKPKIKLTAQERAWLQAHPMIRVAVAQWAPVEFLDEQGQVQGITAEYLQRLEEMLGVRFQVAKNITWSQGMEKVKQHELDMVSSVKRLPERELFLEFTDPYLSLPIAIFAGQDASYTGDLSELAGKKVAVVEGWATHRLLAKNHPDIKLIFAHDITDALKKLAGGDAYAFIGSILNTSYYIGKLGLSHIRVVGGTPYEWQQSMGVRKDWPLLASILGKALAAIPEEEHNTIFRRWVTVGHEHGFDYTRLWQIVAVFSVILLLVFYRNYQLVKHRREQTKVQAALEVSEEKFRGIFDESVAAIYVFDGEKNFIDFNQAGLDLLGYSRDELLGMATLDVDANPNAVIPTHNLLLGEGKISNYEHQLIRKDGKVITVLNNSRPLTGRDGSVSGMQSTLIDITGRKQAEKAYKEAAASQNAILTAIPDLMLELDQDGQYLDIWARKPSELVQIKATLLGHRVSEVLPANAAAQVMTALKEADEKGQSHGQQIQLTTPDGELWFELSTSLKDGESSPHRFIMLSRNITKRKQTEYKLWESETLYRSLIETTDTGYLILDSEGKVIDANQKYVLLTGHQTLEEILNRSVTEWTAEYDLERNASEVEKCMELGFVHDLPIDYVHPDGMIIPVEINAKVVKTEGGLKILSLCRDITKRRQDEEEQAHMQREFQQVQKMEALGQLTGGIAHDFNNILGIIMGYTDLALNHFARDDQTKLVECLKHVENAGERAKNLVAQMLVFSRDESRNDNPLQLQPMIMEDIKMLRAALPTSIEINVEIENDLPYIMMNPIQLNQMLMNMCINARDAMEGKGSITIGLGWANGLNAECDECVTCSRQIIDDWVELSITDTGSGIRPDVLDRIFDPYYTTKDVGKGTGMGLSVVHGIMRNYGGHILVDTEVGKGSTFRLLFPPVIEKTNKTSATDQSTVYLPHGQGEHILVLDDEPDLGKYLAELLESHGYRVTAMTDSRKALELFKEKPNTFTLLITDQTMPGITGVELVKTIRKVRSDIPVILNTGFSDDINAEAAAEMGILYLEKPVMAKSLLQAVKGLLRPTEQSTE